MDTYPSHFFQIVVDKEEDIPTENSDQFITRKQDYLLRSAAVNRNAMTVVEYFAKRVETFIEDVLKPYFGLSHYFVRYEFQAR